MPSCMRHLRRRHPQARAAPTRRARRRPPRRRPPRGRSVASAAVAKRRGSASTSKAAAKQRRQKIFVVVLAVVLAVLLVYQVPRTLKTVKQDEAPVAAAPSATTQPPADGTKRVHGSGNGADLFAFGDQSVPNNDPGVAGAGGPDPFTAPPAASDTTPPPAQALPKQIVIGRPGGNRVAKHGWIVILASISTRNGQSEAVRFARSARRNVGALSVLNSSS